MYITVYTTSYIGMKSNDGVSAASLSLLTERSRNWFKRCAYQLYEIWEMIKKLFGNWVEMMLFSRFKFEFYDVVHFTTSFPFIIVLSLFDILFLTQACRMVGHIFVWYFHASGMTLRVFFEKEHVAGVVNSFVSLEKKVGRCMLISEVEIAGFVDWIERWCCYGDHISSGELTSWLEISSGVVIATTLAVANCFRGWKYSSRLSLRLDMASERKKCWSRIGCSNSVKTKYKVNVARVATSSNRARRLQ